MEHAHLHEGYPLWIILLSNVVSLSTYAIGAFIVSRLGIFWMVAYVGYILALEIRLLSRSCVNCYYYGKLCAFGKGKVASLLFRKGNPEEFNRKEISWKDMVPDLLVPLIPLVIGVALLVHEFDWVLLASMVALVLLATFGNGFVRGSLTCTHCKQGEAGCPAERLFRKK